MKTDRIIGKARQAIGQSAVIIILAAMVGLLTNQPRADRLPVVADRSPEARLASESGESLVISLEEAKALCSDKEAVFLDARSEEEYGRGHIRCAQNIPWQAFERHIDRVFSLIPDDVWIVTYCDGETCPMGEDLALELVFMGYKNVKVLLNGWTRWKEAGFPTEGGQNKFS